MISLATFAVPGAAAQPVLHTFTSPNAQEEGRFGRSLAGIPDTDGDDRGDILVGASEDPRRVYLFSGATGNLLFELAPPVEDDGSFGRSVAGVPDTNGDGRGDLIVKGFVNTDVVFLYSGATGDGISVLFPPDAQDPSFGNSMAGVSDTDGDGRGDVLVTTEFGGADDAGRAYLFSGATGALLFEIASPSGGDGAFGRSVAGVPDADGDGRGDILVGAYGEFGEPESAGRAYLFSGDTGDLLFELVSPNEEEDGLFGEEVAGVPDADGDGMSDLLIGAPFEGPMGSPESSGRAYLFSGATGELLFELTSPNEAADGEFGNSVAGVSDTNDDGRGDLLIGATERPRRAYLFSGATGELLSELASPDVGGDDEGGFGRKVAAVPDTDSDGLGDLLISAESESPDGGLEGAGRAYLFSGGSGPVASEHSLTEEMLALLPVHPNPASGETGVSFRLPTVASIRLSIYDILGREVAGLTEGFYSAGIHSIRFDMSGLPSGLYVLRLETDGLVETRLLTLIR